MILGKNCEEIDFPKIKLSENIATYTRTDIAINADKYSFRDRAILFVIKVLKNSQENMHGVVLRF